MRLGSWCFRPSFFSRTWRPILFKIWSFEVQKKGACRLNQKKRSQHQPSNNPPLSISWVQTLSLPSQPPQPLTFGTFPDWIKTKNISRFLLVRTVCLFFFLVSHFLCNFWKFFFFTSCLSSACPLFLFLFLRVLVQYSCGMCVFSLCLSYPWMRGRATPWVESWECENVFRGAIL